MLLYKKIKIPNFEIISEEILTLVHPQISQNLRFWDVPAVLFVRYTPVFFKYLITSFSRFPILFRFYNTSPYGKLEPHVDNLATAPNKIGFNIPLSGTKNTLMNYYTTSQDNLESSLTAGFGDTPAQLIKDKEKLVLVDSVEIDHPTLVRTDIIHEVVNPNSTYRLVLGMKFKGNKFEDIYKLDL